VKQSTTGPPGLRDLGIQAWPHKTTQEVASIDSATPSSGSLN